MEERCKPMTDFANMKAERKAKNRGVQTIWHPSQQSSELDKALDDECKNKFPGVFNLEVQPIFNNDNVVVESERYKKEQTNH